MLSRAQLGPLRSIVGKDVPIHHLCFGIDTDFFDPSLSAAEPPIEPVVLSLGNDRDRDIPTLLEAFAQIRRAVPAARMVLQTSRVDVARGHAGVTCVTQVSHSDLRDLYKQCSLVMIATRPNLHVSGMTAILEAAAMECPVVITTSPGMEDYLPESVTGVPGADNVTQLAELAVRLLLEPERARMVGAKSRQWVVENRTTVRMADELSSLIERAREA
ncbi:glycosyltransferase family 4 protein [Microbacterium sp. zg-Y818]|uniref:glycosyltransferase family 4 protein n=1 Tax=unclassified Microbacterium TaxID=2609290 RepID=UPI00214B670A|nr:MULTISPECIES: glycosyltransferase family 4 protein [unclassified Microbacterium]MCR2801912.1 glycosyltransferase family 4 protein [Microbacterium sp. zg.Y818]WIM22831.1 glycosyltransferase family 4 protein [Microbacterium sp. zg-Y818]